MIEGAPRPPRHGALAATGGSASWALEFLLSQGLLSGADVVCRSPVAEETSISHISFLVRLDGRLRWFLKRSDPARSGGRDLRTEVTAYRLAGSHPALAAVMPRCWLASPDGSVLVLDALDGIPLTTALHWPLHRAGQRGVLRAYGEAVARVHAARLPRFGQPPWMLVSLEPRWGRYPWLPPECGDLLRRLAAFAPMQAAFEQARRHWKTTCLIHGDLRWANAILDERGEQARVWLVDWELACNGDPAWDVGSMLADVAATVALTGVGDPLANEAAVLWAPILAGYRAASRLAAPSWASLLESSVRLAGVRLIQTIIEHGHASGQDLHHAEAVLLPWAIRFLEGAHTLGVTLGAQAAQPAFQA